ncbi:MAG TPA: hypothetical protein PKC49_06045 [Phycisphaerae bacterium]|nr:hypothetical protein [Phycisphaerae bacterium]
MAQGNASDAAVRAGYAERLARLDKLRVTYDWSLRTVAPTDDPFDAGTWRPVLHDLEYTVALCRPDFQFRINRELVRGPEDKLITKQSKDSGRTDESSWVDGLRVRKVQMPDGYDHVTVYNTRFSVTGPIPFLTALEVFHTFDVQHSLLELWQAGLVRLVETTAAVHVVSGKVHLAELEPGDCTVTARLDRATLVPRELSLTIPHPDGKRGNIDWTMRVVKTQTINGAAMISEAVIALNNTINFADRTTVYHFRVNRLEPVPTLAKEQLRLAIPEREVIIVDEVKGFARHVGQDGTVLREEKWTPEERAAMIAGGHEAARLREQSLLRVEQRKTLFLYILAAAALATLVAGVWWWRRRSRLAKLHA